MLKHEDFLADCLEALQRDLKVGQNNRPEQTKKRAKLRPKSITFRHVEPKQTKPWKDIIGEDHCIFCDTTKEVIRNKFQLMQPVCKDCRAQLRSGDISPQEFIDKMKFVRPQPVQTGATTGRVRAIKGSLVKVLGNAKWIRCQCGRAFKTFPFKPYETHPPAFEKWITHARGDQRGHMPIDWSDRNPNGESAVMARLHPLTGWPRKEK